MNCWNTLRAFLATTETVKLNVNAKKRKDWAISSEASMETQMNVQRLLKLPKLINRVGGVSMEEVNRNVRRRPYEARDKERLIEKIIELHEHGMSQVDIAKTLCLGRGTILRWNKELQLFKPRTPGEAGKLKNKKYRYNENYFKQVDTANKAYLVGYITGDGTIFDRGKSKRLVLSLAEKDRQLLEDIATELCMLDAMKLRPRTAPNEQNKYALTINSTEMCNDLIKLGITPRKTGLERWINFGREDLQWAYLRGFFDADGHISSRRRLGFTGNSQMLLSLLQFLHSKQLALSVHKLYPKQGCVDLYITRKEDVKKIAQQLYKYGSIRLNRKYEKIKSFFDDIV